MKKYVHKWRSQLQNDQTICVALLPLIFYELLERLPKRMLSSEYSYRNSIRILRLGLGSWPEDERIINQ